MFGPKSTNIDVRPYLVFLLTDFTRGVSRLSIYVHTGWIEGEGRRKGSCTLLPDGICCLQLLKPRYVFSHPSRCLYTLSLAFSDQLSLPQSKRCVVTCYLDAPCASSEYWRWPEVDRRERERKSQCRAKKILFYGNLEEYNHENIQIVRTPQNRRRRWYREHGERRCPSQQQNCMKISTIFAKLSIGRAANGIHGLQNWIVPDRLSTFYALSRSLVKEKLLDFNVEISII